MTVSFYENMSYNQLNYLKLMKFLNVNIPSIDRLALLGIASFLLLESPSSGLSVSRSRLCLLPVIYRGVSRGLKMFEEVSGGVKRLDCRYAYR